MLFDILPKFGILKSSKAIISNNILPVLSGYEIFIPIEILSKTSIENYYNVNFMNVLFNSVDFQLIVLLSFLLSYVTYKGDRLLDAEEYIINNLNSKKEFIINDKDEYYKKLINNKKIIQFSLFTGYIAIIILIVHLQIKELFPLFISTFCYKYIKSSECKGNNELLNIPIKPFYIAFLWTYLSCLLPIQFIDEVNFNEVQNYNYYLPVLLNIFATTNLADIKDYKEDLYNNISTLPTKIGLEESKYIIVLAALLSNYFFVNNNNFEINLQNAFFIFSNIGSLFTLYAL